MYFKDDPFWVGEKSRNIKICQNYKLGKKLLILLTKYDTIMISLDDQSAS